MTEPVHPTPDEFREQAETDIDGVLGGSFAERTQRLIDELDHQQEEAK